MILLEVKKKVSSSRPERKLAARVAPPSSAACNRRCQRRWWGPEAAPALLVPVSQIATGRCRQQAAEDCCTVGGPSGPCPPAVPAQLPTHRRCARGGQR